MLLNSRKVCTIARSIYMNNVLVLQRSVYVAPTDYYKVGSSPSDMIRQHDTLGQIRNVDVQSDHGQTSFSELLHGNADSLYRPYDPSIALNGP